MCIINGNAVFLGLLLMATVVAVFPDAPRKSESGEKMICMIEEEVERRLREADFSGLTEGKMSTLEKKEYSFYKDYVHSGSRQKMMLITLLQGAEQPWCFKYYLELLKDHDGAIRSDAAKGISDLGSGIDAKKLMSEIDRLNAVVGNERILGMANLVLAIGNSKDPSLLESLLLHYSKEIDPALREAYQKATAKLGFKKSIREIEIQLLSGDGYQKNDALVKVLYINSPEWVGTLVPLLIDEEVGVSMPWGSGS